MDIGKRSHKLKKGETLEKVARKFGHKSADSLWKHEKNKRLRSKRKTKESLMPGDVLYIPLNDKEKKEVGAAIEVLGSLIGIELDLHKALADTYAECAGFAGSLEAVRLQTMSSMKIAESGLLTAAAEIRRARSAKDLPKDTKKLAKQNENLMKAIKKDLDEAMKAAKAAEAIQKTGKLPKPGAVKKTGKLVSSGFKQLNEFVKSAEADSASSSVTGLAEALSKKSAKAFSNLQTEILGMTKGRFWYDLFFFGDYELLDADREKDKFVKTAMEQVNNMRRLSAGMNMAFKVTIKLYDASARTAKKEMDACYKRIKDLEKQAKDFPSLMELKKL